MTTPDGYSSLSSKNYLIGVEVQDDTFMYVHESPYLKNKIPKNANFKRDYVNIFEKLDLEKEIEEINKATLKWNFQSDKTCDLGPYFDVYCEHKMSQSPEYVFHYKLKKEHTPSQAMKYFMSHSIAIDCSLGMTIFILYLTWKYLGDEKFDRLHPIFILKSISVNINPLIKLLFKTYRFGRFEPCKIDEHTEKIKKFRPGTFCYIRGVMGWYNFIVSPEKFDRNKLEVNRQGENLIYVGNGKFLGYWRRDAFDSECKDNTASFVSQDYQTIIDSLNVNGKRTLLESVDNHRHLYQRYLVYYMDDEDNSDIDSKSININRNKVASYVGNVLDEGREEEDSKLNVLYNPFESLGIDGYSDMYLDMSVIRNIDKFIEEQKYYQEMVDAIFKAYQRNFFTINDSVLLLGALDNFEREYNMFGIIDNLRHVYHNLVGWDHKIPLIMNNQIISDHRSVYNVIDKEPNLVDIKFFSSDRKKKSKKKKN